MKSIRNDEALLAELNKTAAARSSAVEKAQRIRDAEAAVIAAVLEEESAEDEWDRVYAVSDNEPGEAVSACTKWEAATAKKKAAVRALHEARKP